MIEHRRKQRKEVGKSIVVNDALLNRPVGRVVNLSEEGFMVIGDGLISENCLYQLSMELNSESDNSPKISLGAECLWLKETDSGTQYWAGFHVIDISDGDLKTMLTLIDDHPLE